MLWVDFALQAFRDIRGAAAVRLQAGYNLLVCDSAIPETVLEGLFELLFPGVVTELGRGILTFVGRDGPTYRVLRDFHSGGAQLYAFDAVKRQFMTVADGAAAVAPLMHQQVVVPSRQLMNDVFVLSADHMPARDTPPPHNPAARERLRQLEAKIATQGRGKQIETELDDMTQRKLEIDDLVSTKAGDARRLRQLEALLSQYAHLSVLPDNFLQLYETAHAREAQRVADLTRWQHEHDEQERLLRASERAPLLKDARIIAGLAVGILAVGVGLAIGGPYRHIAYLDIPALGLSTLALWQNLSHREELLATKRRLAASDRRREQIETRDAELIAKAKELAATVGFTNIHEVREVIGARDAAKTAFAEAQRVFEATESDPELVRLREEQTLLAQEIKTHETELSTVGLSGSDVGAMQAEAAGLRRLLGIRKAGDDGGFQRTFAVATQLFGGDATQTAMTLTQRATQFVTHLSAKRITRVEVDIDGSLAVVAPHGVITPDRLQPAARELVVLALRGALLTAIPAAQRLPLVVGPFTPMNGDKLLRGYLGVLAQAGMQVIHLLDKAARAEGTPALRFTVTA